MHEWPSKDQDHDPKGKKVLQASLKLDTKGSEDCLSDLCFMVIEEEMEENFERAFEELYMETICIAKKDKELLK